MQDSSPEIARQPNPLCDLPGSEVPAMAAIIYHGVVYHPACIEPTLRRASDTIPTSPPSRGRGA
jgi:hypothetical protein